MWFGCINAEFRGGDGHSPALQAEQGPGQWAVGPGQVSACGRPWGGWRPGLLCHQCQPSLSVANSESFQEIKQTSEFACTCEIRISFGNFTFFSLGLSWLLNIHPNCYWGIVTVTLWGQIKDRYSLPVCSLILSMWAAGQEAWTVDALAPAAVIGCQDSQVPSSSHAVVTSLPHELHSGSSCGELAYNMEDLWLLFFPLNVQGTHNCLQERLLLETERTAFSKLKTKNRLL